MAQFTRSGLRFEQVERCDRPDGWRGVPVRWADRPHGWGPASFDAHVNPIGGGRSELPTLPPIGPAAHEGGKAASCRAQLPGCTEQTSRRAPWGHTRSSIPIHVPIVPCQCDENSPVSDTLCPLDLTRTARTYRPRDPRRGGEDPRSRLRRSKPDAIG